MTLAQRVRSPRLIIGPAILAAIVVLAYVEAPDTGAFVRFTLLGLATGAVYAVSSAGLVLTYSTTGVFNFAHGAVGMIAAYSYYELRVANNWPTPVAVVVVVVVVGLFFGLALERVMRSFANSAPGTTLTVTIAITVLLIGVAQTGFPEINVGKVVPQFFGDRVLTVAGLNLSWDDVFVMVVAIATALALRYLLFVSRTGVAMRAVVDNPDLAALNGAQPVAVARAAWMLGSVLAALAGVLYAPRFGGLNEALFSFAVVTAFGAAVVGKLSSLPRAFAGALGLGVLQSWFVGLIIATDDPLIGESLPLIPFTDVNVPWSSIALAIPALFLLGALLFLPQLRLTVGRVVSRDEPAIPSLRRSLVASAAFLVLVAVVAAVMPETYLPDTARALVYGLLILSLVLLTGFSGQISLAQYVFLGLGAWAMSTVGDGGSLLGLAAAAAVAVPFGAFVALPALRLQGLYLALSTFAIATASRDLIFQNESIFGLTNRAVGRPSVLGVDFSGNRMFIVFCGIVFTLVGLGVLAVRRSSFGRRLAAMRDSPTACATLGLDLRRTKLVVFCASAAIAGFAGGMFGSLNSTVGTIDFEALNNAVLFLFAFVGGITTVTGALIGGALFALLPLVQVESPSLAGLVFAAVAVTAVLLGRQPNGMAGLLFARLQTLRAPQGGGEPTVGAGAAAQSEQTTDLGLDGRTAPGREGAHVG